MNLDAVVYGERIADLLPALLKFRESVEVGPDGMYLFSVTLDRDEASPLRRALMRVEAELLKEDADTIGTQDQVDRSHTQRAADALLRLVKRSGIARSEGFEPPTF